MKKTKSLYKKEDSKDLLHIWTTLELRVCFYKEGKNAIALKKENS